MALLFPLWQVNRAEYEAICAYLGLSPNARLYDRLSRLLSTAPFRYHRPSGFPAFLGALRLTRFRIARLDLLTKMRFRDHRLRHAINGVLALHECDPEGYRQMSTAPSGWAVLPRMVAWGFRSALGLLITVPWLGWQAFRYALDGAGRGRAALDGKRVLITGVSRGLGLDIMLHCLERGAKVIGVVRNEQTAQELRATLPAEAPVTLLSADLAAPGALVTTLRDARIRPEEIAVAILCAGVKHDGESVLALRSLRDTFEVNFFSAAEFAAWFCAPAHTTSLGGGPEAADPAHAPHPATPGSSPTPAGDESVAATLVMISSIGRWHGMHGTCGYNASKAALSVWSESLEMELRQSRRRAYSITVVEPGMFESGMTGKTGLAGLLSVSRRELAGRIVTGALAGKRSIRAPLWFALLTWTVCLLGRDFRYRLFSRVKPKAPTVG